MGPAIANVVIREAGLNVETKLSAKEEKEDVQNQDSQDSAQESAHESPLGVEGEDDNGRPAVAPLQKRRRVTRACDECRRKKIKCDGKQPCTHCTVYSYECTYDQPSNRRRNAPPHYVENLENQLKRAQAVLNLVMPNADLNDPDLELRVRRVLSFSPSPIRSTPTSTSQILPDEIDAGIDDHLESMVRSTGQLDLDEQGNLEYHGHSSGLSFVRRMKESLGNVVLAEGKGTPFVKSRPMSQVFDSPRSLSDSPWDAHLPGSDLPPKEVAKEMCDMAVNDAGALLRFVHYPTFLRQVDQLYEVSPENYGNEENMFLPLFYSVLSVATLFRRGESFGGYEGAINEGFKYFKQCRQLMDIADCRDLRQLQALVFMIIFLQSSAKLSVCYAYIGVALRAALRLGLHRCFNEKFTPIEAETRKRVFWVIRKMDTYVGALLGLPHALGDDQIDQDFPSAVDDEYITETEILPMPEGKVSVMAAANAHTRLVQILAKIVQYIYPVKASRRIDANGKRINTYSVSYSKIMEIEQDLRAWHDELPMGLRPGGDAPRVILRCQHLLRMAFAHAQMMLYRPFLHYVSQARVAHEVDKRSYACAAACVSVSRNIVHIAVEMRKRGLLGGAYWFSMYTTFFAILSLVFYALENPANEASKDVLKVAKEGKDTLESLAAYSMAADRCNETLKSLFEQLPHVTNQTRIAHGKKRRQEGNVRFGLVIEDDVNGEPPFAGIQPVYGPEAKFQHNVYDANPSFTTPSTPSLASGFTMSVQENSLPGSPVVGNPAFPLADMSSMMFPNPDPFAYPNQQSGADAKFDNLLKNLQSTAPIPASFDRYQVEPTVSTNDFSTQSQTYMMSSELPQQSQQLTSQEADVQLLGPMPMYMMQGGAGGNSFNLYENSISGTPPTHSVANGSSTQSSGTTNQQVRPTQAQFRNQVNKRNATLAPNVNLNDLLGGSEWTGLPSDRSAFPTQIEPNNAQINSQGPSSYDDMNPNVLAWGLEGY